ncbi:hypothetical protein MPER_10198, partial [Moniliophthora perniciosa FA553]
MIDYSIYLVTGRDLLPAGKDFFETLEQVMLFASLQGGVTVVQIREKKADTAEKSANGVDIALAINASGVHVGQSDMPIAIARKLLPKGAIIGASCNNLEEVKKALTDGADYIGIGAVWATTTKALDKPV